MANMNNQATYHMESFLDIPIETPNRITKKEKTYHISYNNIDTDTDAYGCDTTALYINETSQFLVLNGKHTDKYNDCNTLQDCINYFYLNIEQANPKSEHGKVFKYDGVKAEYVNGGY